MKSEEVFISYSHDSDEHIYRVIGLTERLISEGVNIKLDVHYDPDEGWQQWMLNKIEEAEHILAICTENYFQRANRKEEQGKGKGVKWETRLIFQRIYEADSENANVIPVVFNEADLEYIPLPLKSASHYDLSKPDGYENLYRKLTGQPRFPAPPLGKKRVLAPKSLVSYPTANGDLLPQIIKDSTLLDTEPKVLNAAKFFEYLDFRYTGDEELATVEFLNDFIKKFSRVPQSSRELLGIMAERSVLLGCSPIMGSSKVEVNLHDLQEACGINDYELYKQIHILEDHKFIDFWPEHQELKLLSYDGWNILVDLARYCKEKGLKMNLFTTDLNFHALDS